METTPDELAAYFQKNEEELRRKTEDAVSDIKALDDEDLEDVA